MRKIFHSFSLTPEWMDELAEQTETKVIDNKFILFPKKIGNGHLYFTRVTPGISVLFIDLSLNTSLKIIRKVSDNDLYIFHFDLSEHINLIKINNKDYEIGSFDKLDLAIIDNQIESSYQPAVHERTFALRILVDKKLLTNFTAKYSNQEYIVSKKNKNEFYHYGNIDSNSTLLLKSLKIKSIHDLSFDSFIKGTTLKLLGNFFSRFYNPVEKEDEITEIETQAVNKTKEYLLANLHSPFPSVIFLASMARMSESKYKTIFKKCFSTTPNHFFIQQKLMLSRELLKSGQFHSLTEVVYELSYNKLSHFSVKYFEFFNKKPNEDFVKNPARKKRIII